MRDMTVSRSTAARSFLFRLATALAIVLFFAALARAGGPAYVAGSSYFNSGTMGQPITWSQGQVNYYTDQGDLSPILPNASANAFVASAFTEWTSVSTAALTANAAGQLAEDVNGGNIAVNSSGAVTAPADIAPSATQTPVGIVYDYDGSVTDALLGAGAGDPSQCFWNAVYGGVDNFGTGANFLHALVVINGQCALQSSQLTDVEYRLVRVLGSVIGLGWSQMNLNVITGNPHPTPDDYAGFPVMHFMDPVICVPITVCYANPYQLAPDDMAAFSRLYPAGSPATTARIYGSVYFVNHTGAEAQPMQGVNVVARWIDPSTNLPSDHYGASSTSGFLFSGNAGNPITGLDDPRGNPYSEFGSSDPTLEGFFDLGGLPVPNGASTAQYQLSVEALNPLWSAGVCPYDPSQVAPSGTLKPIVVTVNLGGGFEQDVVMSGSAQPVPPWAATETWSAPAPVPSPGDWVGSLSGYGDVGYFLITAQANRTLSVAVTALDETSAPSESKAEPVVDMWALGDPQGTAPPALTAAPFNSATFGMSRLDAEVLSPSSFIIGIADLRGDGRPDYHYHAHVLYGDSAIPPRVPVSGGAITLQGTGFAPGRRHRGQLRRTFAGNQRKPDVDVRAFAKRWTSNHHHQRSGQRRVLNHDQCADLRSRRNRPDCLVTGIESSNAGGNPGHKPCDCAGARFRWRHAGERRNRGMDHHQRRDTLHLRRHFHLLGDQRRKWNCFHGGHTRRHGECGDHGHSRPRRVQPIPVGSGDHDGYVLVLGHWSHHALSLDRLGGIAQRAADGARGRSGRTTGWQTGGFLRRSGIRIAQFRERGDQQQWLRIRDADVDELHRQRATQRVRRARKQTLPNHLWECGGRCDDEPASRSRCGPGGHGCGVSALTVRVTDSSTPPNPVLGASVLFQSTVLLPAGNNLVVTPGDPAVTPPGMPVILSASQSTAISDVNGLASFIPSVGSFTGPLEIEIQVSAGTTAVLQNEVETFPAAGSGNTSPTFSQWRGRVPAPRGPPLFAEH
jgi:hypothetical protein